ncbi:MAG TPA: hypothetical protein VMT19_03525 [Thermoanaerobaculaceae bacterium]|nr:hypothetical protein [Thermoanaerobaculaceae bacterium]
MRTRGCVLCAVLVATWASGSGAQTVELEGRYWPATLTARVRVLDGQTDVPPDLSTIDLKDDLGLSNKSLADGRLSLTTGPHSRLRVGFVRMDYSADHIVERTIVFNGTPYTVGTEVVTKLKLDYWRYGWIWEFVGTPSSPVRFGTLLEAKTFSIDASLAAPRLTPPVAEAKKLTATLPSAGLVLELNPVPMVNVFAEASGISAGSRGHALDAEVGVKIKPAPVVAVVGGYRYFDLEARDDPDFATIKNSGPYVGVALRF